MEFDFIVVVKKGRTHVLANHMSRFPNKEAPIEVDDELPNTPLFVIDLVLERAEQICHYLTNGLPTNRLLDVTSVIRLIRDSTPYQLIARQLYKHGKDKIVH